MTVAIQHLLETFDALSDEEKREATIEVLRRFQGDAGREIPEDTLIWAAEELFLELDAREESDA